METHRGQEHVRRQPSSLTCLIPYGRWHKKAKTQAAVVHSTAVAVNVVFPIGSTSDAIGKNLGCERGTTPKPLRPAIM